MQESAGSVPFRASLLDCTLLSSCILLGSLCVQVRTLTSFSYKDPDKSHQMRILPSTSVYFSYFFFKDMVSGQSDVLRYWGQDFNTWTWEGVTVQLIA